MKNMKLYLSLASLGLLTNLKAMDAESALVVLDNSLNDLQEAIKKMPEIEQKAELSQTQQSPLENLFKTAQSTAEFISGLSNIKGRYYTDSEKVALTTEFIIQKLVEKNIDVKDKTKFEWLASKPLNIKEAYERKAVAKKSDQKALERIKLIDHLGFEFLQNFRGLIKETVATVAFSEVKKSETVIKQQDKEIIDFIVNNLLSTNIKQPVSYRSDSLYNTFRPLILDYVKTILNLPNGPLKSLHITKAQSYEGWLMMIYLLTDKKENLLFPLDIKDFYVKSQVPQAIQEVQKIAQQQIPVTDEDILVLGTQLVPKQEPEIKQEIKPEVMAEID